MVYTRNPTVSTRFSGICNSEAGAQGFVHRLVMQTVFEVLERQARSALLPDAIISTILDQLHVMTSNIIKANWSRTIWQSVVNRAVRMLASGPFGQHFSRHLPLSAETE
ncbi:hypothetical protein KIN20_004016 [Parelaphostrongylus tenuis]|uniref:Uncharacterized protein n=1 Tax=Parelaphostrongylus tenuis TaxID=148309 RepID=A0AAD5MJA4_PARTN|nr:hypothetical protein KIN20_004016 [Parelaphostrongylus tenuis]